MTNEEKDMVQAALDMPSMYGDVTQRPQPQLAVWDDHNFKLIQVALQHLADSLEWLPIESAPRDGVFLTREADHPPFVIAAEIYWNEPENTPKHLSMKYFTHWLPLPDTEELKERIEAL